MEILRKYGQAATFLFPLIDRGAMDFEATPVAHEAGDTNIIKDEAVAANTANAFVHEGFGIYSLALTATEMEAARIVVTIIDQTNPKAWEDQALVISTYGNASAQHAFDLDTATQSVAVASIAADAITAASIAANAIGSSEIADGAITAAKIATDAIDADALAAGAITADVFAAGAINAAAIAADAIGASELAADAVAEIADAVWDEALADHVAAGSMGANQNLADDAIAGLVAINADTDNIQSRLPAALVGGRMDASVGAVQADAITAAGLAVDAVAEIADAVWDELAAEHVAAGTMGAVENLLLNSSVAVALNVEQQAGVADNYLVAINTFFSTVADVSLTVLDQDGNLVIDAEPMTALAGDKWWKYVDADNLELGRKYAASVQATLDGEDRAFLFPVSIGRYITGSEVGDIADAVWDENLPGDHDIADSAGAGVQNTFADAEAIAGATIPNPMSAKLEVTDDNAGSEDVYTAAFFWYGAPLMNPADITDPDLWVYDQDGNDLVGTSAAPVPLVQIGSTATYKRVEAANRIVSGTAYFARVRAVIDGGVRTWIENRITRDST